MMTRWLTRRGATVEVDTVLDGLGFGAVATDADGSRHRLADVVVSTNPWTVEFALRAFATARKWQQVEREATP